MILHRSLALPRSVLNSTLSTTEASFSSVKIYGTISKRNFVRLSRGQRIVKPFISGPYVFRAYHWYQAQASRHSCIDESDPLLFPSLFHFRFPISLSFSTFFLHGRSRALVSKRSEFQRRNFPIFNRNVVCSIDTFWYGLRLQLWN